MTFLGDISSVKLSKKILIFSCLIVPCYSEMREVDVTRLLNDKLWLPFRGEWLLLKYFSFANHEDMTSPYIKPHRNINRSTQL